MIFYRQSNTLNPAFFLLKYPPDKTTAKSFLTSIEGVFLLNILPLTKNFLWL